MTSKREKRPEFVVIWEFRVSSGKRRAFEKVHGPDGIWDAIFRGSEDYIRTELVRDRKKPLRYVTVDIWRSRQAYLQFQKKNRTKYQAIDKKCEGLTTSERLIGEFLNIGFPDVLVSAISESGSQFSSVADGSSYSIRPATASDVAKIITLERETPSAAHWPEPTYRRVFAEQSPARIALLATQGGQSNATICGFVIARVAPGECELENIVVARSEQSRGLGSQLVQSLAEAARNQKAMRIFLEVRESNAAARALYEKCGFAITGRRSDYYIDPPEDAVLYALQL
jgi:[ribosomal protein S18]-alanine N-acetyltransferase